MSLPIHDWQFWIATTLAGIALVAVLRALVPQAAFPKFLRRRPKGRRATLTVGGQAVGKSTDPPPAKSAQRP